MSESGDEVDELEKGLSFLLAGFAEARECAVMWKLAEQAKTIRDGAQKNLGELESKLNMAIQLEVPMEDRRALQLRVTDAFARYETWSDVVDWLQRSARKVVL